MDIRQLVRALLLCALLAPVQSFAQTPAVSAPAQQSSEASASEQSYVLGSDDVVEMEVLGRADFRVRARIGSDGKIQVPFLGNVDASNRTARELADEIAAALERGGYFSKPIMRIEVVSYASRYVIVLGAIAQPGLVPVNRAYRLSEIIARVGGIRETGADYVVLRPEKGEERRVSMVSLATGGNDQDPYVSPGDKIFVPTAEVFYISGQIKLPGAYPIASSMTLRMAIARGGGLTDLGSDRRVQVTRGGKKLDRVELDSKLEPGDVVVVGERIF